MKRHHLVTPLIALAAILALAACGDDGSTAATEDPTAQLTPGQLRFGESFPGDLLEGFPEHDTDPVVDEATLAEIHEGNVAFALEAYSHLREQQDEGLVFSPLSLQVAFAMADEIGPIKDEIKATTRLTPPGELLHPVMNRIGLDLTRHNGATQGDGDPFLFQLGNGAWVVAPSYATPQAIEAFGRHYDAPIALLPLSSKPSQSEDQINAWISDRTHELIPELLQENITIETLAVVVNTAYLKAPWRQPFSENATAPAPFTLRDGTVVEVETMESDIGTFDYAHTDEADVLSLPFVGAPDADPIELLVLAPAQGTFEDFEAALTPERLNALRDGATPQSAVVHIPTFHINSRPTFQWMLGDCDPASETCIDVIHQADITVDEKGTEAAAATAIVFFGGNNGGPPEYIDIHIDRPFLFFVRQVDSGVILFMGRYTGKP